MFKGFYRAITDYGRALDFLIKHRLLYFFLFPLLLNLILFFFGLQGVNYLTAIVEAHIFDWLSLANPDKGFLEALSEYHSYFESFLSVLIWVALKIIFFFAFSFISGYIVLVLLSPVFAYLSEKTEAILTGNQYPFIPEQFVMDVARGIYIATRNMLIQTMLTTILLLLGLVPVVGWVVPFILFIVAAYFYGFSFMDYSNERNRISIKNSIHLIKKNKGVAIGNGTVFLLVLFIPFFGSIIAGFIAILSVVAATISMQYIYSNNNG